MSVESVIQNLLRNVVVAKDVLPQDAAVEGFDSPQRRELQIVALLDARNFALVHLGGERYLEASAQALLACGLK